MGQKQDILFSGLKSFEWLFLSRDKYAEQIKE